jgi:hypothetical protein
VVGVEPSWSEVDVTAEGAPAYSQGYGSPSVLVDGHEVTGTATGSATSCRLYLGSDLPGAPPLDVIVAALRNAIAAEPQ